MPEHSMTKNRLEAFSDGVIAIIITIMVLELKMPEGSSLSSLWDMIPDLLCYLLSFVFIGIYWNNHHHLLHTVRHVTGGELWANLHLLFWLSLVPWITRWMGHSKFASGPVAMYGLVLLCSAMAYTILVRTIIAVHGKDSVLATAVGRDAKGLASLAIYVAGFVLAFFCPRIACLLYALVALIWLVPDRRIERVIGR
jgi:uncharacterized membrane protein